MPDNPILQSISQWFKRNFSDPEAISLFMVIVFSLILLELFGKILMPVLVSIVLAYLLVSPVRLLIKWRCPPKLAVFIVYILFIGFVVYLLLVLVPLLWRQTITLFNVMPDAFTHSQVWLQKILAKYPSVSNAIQFDQFATYMQSEFGKMGQILVRLSLATIPGVIQIVLYFVLVPILVFFFLKDRREILTWFQGYLPSNRGLVTKVAEEVRGKIGAYVRGRVLEIIIVALVSAATFALLGLQYALLLGILVGLSVIIPYVGAVIVTIPIVIIALMQWGFSAEFLYVMIAYTVIIALDGNVLMPVLFSESMDLHPVVVILSVVIFGAIWGFWGVFFAIPLATLVNAILRAWPRANRSITSSADH